MPMSQAFKDRLCPHLDAIAEHYGTPFHIYDETGIRETGQRLREVFRDLPVFQEYFAVKALPNLSILSLIRDMDFGFDCSSIPELLLARRCGADGAGIMFTSNNTTMEEFEAAEAQGGCILNLDDISLIDKVPHMPDLICFRYNPGPLRTGNDIIGKPEEAKYGISHKQILDAYLQARAKGARRFGLHTMLASNELNYRYMVQTADMLLRLAADIGEDLGIRFEFINIGGGMGIPYTPEDQPFDLDAMGREITALFMSFKEQYGYCPGLLMESGRLMTGPHGVLVTRAINRKEIYRTYVGVDACMSALMRPAIYGAYHHIEVLGKEGRETEVVDVVGSLCENNDKFAIQRELPKIAAGDLLVIQDTGAHGYAMGFNYNGRLRPKELLMRPDGTVHLIRRAEELQDYFATLHFQEDVMRL